jgi:hypothetical protein
VLQPSWWGAIKVWEQDKTSRFGSTAENHGLGEAQKPKAREKDRKAMFESRTENSSPGVDGLGAAKRRMLLFACSFFYLAQFWTNTFYT